MKRNITETKLHKVCRSMQGMLKKVCKDIKLSKAQFHNFLIDVNKLIARTLALFSRQFLCLRYDDGLL